MNDLLTDFGVGQALCVRVSVPVASFGIPFSREFIETYPFPTPATAYGMILAYIGEVDRSVYVGARLGIVVMELGTPSVVLRKIRRVKSTDLNDGKNSKPEFQTVLTGLEFVVALSVDATGLAERTLKTFKQPHDTLRFGGLSCGESHNLIDELSVITTTSVEEDLANRAAFCLQPDQSGEWSVPVWVDHVGTRNTVWERAAFCPIDRLENLGMFEIRSPK